MAGSMFKKFIPAFIPLAYELVRQVRRNSSHNSDIKKFDKAGEQLNTIEHLIVRLEKKVQSNRDEIRSSRIRLRIWLGINSALLIAIFVKVFFF